LLPSRVDEADRAEEDETDHRHRLALVERPAQ
jgi:hypothetical protein